MSDNSGLSIPQVMWCRTSQPKWKDIESLPCEGVNTTMLQKIKQLLGLVISNYWCAHRGIVYMRRHFTRPHESHACSWSHTAWPFAHGVILHGPVQYCHYSVHFWVFPYTCAKSKQRYFGRLFVWSITTKYNFAYITQKVHYIPESLHLFLYSLFICGCSFYSNLFRFIF